MKPTHRNAEPINGDGESHRDFVQDPELCQAESQTILGLKVIFLF